MFFFLAGWARADSGSVVCKLVRVCGSHVTELDIIMQPWGLSNKPFWKSSCGMLWFDHASPALLPLRTPRPKPQRQKALLQPVTVINLIASDCQVKGFCRLHWVSLAAWIIRYGHNFQARSWSMLELTCQTHLFMRTVYVLDWLCSRYSAL